MKRKIGELYNKPIVEGDKNLVTKNETHISELQGNSNNEGGGSNSNIELTKGKKILSEYYYFDYLKLGTDVLAGIIPQDFIHLLLNYIATDNNIDQKQSQVLIENVEFGLSEINHTIYKIIADNIIIFYEDNIPQVSGEPDVIQIAIKKYCKAYPPIGSGSEQYSTPNIYISINELFDCTNRFPAPFDEMIAPYLITEEEFWAEAKIINDINEL